MKQFFKKKSKRMTTRKLKKIEKKVREHTRKKKKEAKKNPQSLKRKDPGVPNSAPFKEQVLKEAEERKHQIEEERIKHKEKQKKARQNHQNKKRNLSNLVQDAQKRGQAFDKQKASGANETQGEAGTNKPLETSRKAYYKEFRKVIDSADVILQVLDARDPLGSRCVDVENAVIDASSKKKLVLILNKIDLVPRENAEKWLKYLRNEFPTIAFKASTQNQKENLSQAKIKVMSSRVKDEALKTSKCLGADVLMKLLANYCRNQNVKTAITVGVVGFPNTGKSSIINSLKRCRACSVGATPGVTKTMQIVQLDKMVKLLDSPGIVMATGGSNASVILRNCVRVETIEDPITPVQAILNRCNKEKMMLHYNLAEYSTVTEFLSLLARRLGRLKKGGVPDVFKAAKSVLQDWNTGRITYYTHPPEPQSAGQAQILAQMSDAFDIDALMNADLETLKDLGSASEGDIVMDSGGPSSAQLEAPPSDDDTAADGDDNMVDEEEEEMEEDEDQKELRGVSIGEGKRTPRVPHSVILRKQRQKTQLDASIAGNQQLLKSKKKSWKKHKKQKKKDDKVAGSLSDALEGAMDTLGSSTTTKTDTYDFSVDFK